MRDLPVPQNYTGNSRILTVPAKRLPKDIENFFHLNQYISQLEIGEGKINQYFRLGEKFYPSIGITTEQVYPYVVCLDNPVKELRWVSMDELFLNFDKLEDAHLLICLARLRHALEMDI